MSNIITVGWLGAGTDADPWRPDISEIDPKPAGYRIIEEVDEDNVKIEYWGEDLVALADAATTVAELKAVVKKAVPGES